MNYVKCTKCGQAVERGDVCLRASCYGVDSVRGALPDSRRAITGDLTVLREYSCGCIVYLDAKKQEINERGIFCGHNSWPRHRSALVKGQETQVSLFSAG